MAEFTDRDGQTWNLEMTYYDLQEIQKATGVKLIRREQDPEDAAEPGQEIVNDADKFMTAVYLTVADQAEDRDMSAEEVKQLFSRGPFLALIEAWTSAFYEFLGVSAEEVEEVAERPTEGGD